MNAITGLSGIAGTAATAALSSVQGAGGAASGAIGAIAGRVQAWVEALAPGGGAPRGDFVPDRAALARGGDIYGLRVLAGELSRQFGATPAQEGDLSRALEDHARASMVDAALLHGAPDGVRGEGVGAALDAAARTDGEGVDGLVARLEAGTAALTARQR